MIDELHVSNVALIEHAEVQFSEAMTVLSGETGAGKTALLSALKLIMGERADASAVREGQKALEVQARLFGLCTNDVKPGEAPEDTAGVLPTEFYRSSCDNTCCDDELIVTRKVGSDGRSRVSLNGSLSSVSELSSLVGQHIDLCGQHEHQRLLKPAFHGQMLDAWIGVSAQERQRIYEHAFKAYHQACAELNRVQELALQGSSQVDDARILVRRIEQIAPQEGEYEKLEADLARLEHGEVLAQAAHQAYGALRDESCALDHISVACSALEEVLSYDETVAEYHACLEDARIILEDCARDLRGYRDRVEFDEAGLEQTRQRLHDLDALKRAYGPRMCDVLQKYHEAQALISAFDESDESIDRAQRAVDAAKTKLLEAGEEYHRLRLEAKEQFSAAVNEVLEELEMKGAHLDVALEMRSFELWGAHSPSTVELLFSPGSRMSARPLAKIASGGEASRVMLAIKAVMGNADEVQTLVFDEIDAGVGGRTAHAVAQVLSRLAQTHQVIVVTHLAQIAVCADVHYTVSKQQTDDGQSTTSLTLVEGEDRIQEVARMLSGDTSQTSLNHARELLARVR